MDSLNVPKLGDATVLLEIENKTKLPILPQELIEFINCYNLAFEAFEAFEAQVHNFRKKYSVLKIEKWFLECRYNPEYNYCRWLVNQEYDKLRYY